MVMGNEGIGGGIEKAKIAICCIWRNMVAMRGYVEGKTVTDVVGCGSVNSESEARGEVG